MTMEGLRERLNNGKDIIVAEGYLMELERRGYLQAGAFIPEVVLEHPEVVKGLHEEFVHAGSDVVVAFTYYGHRAKLKIIGREDDLMELNVRALKMAKEVAVKTGTLMAGDICNTTIFRRDDPKSIEEVREMFREQIEWAVQCGADYIIAERYDEFAEAMLALECIKEYGNGLPAVVTLTPQAKDETKDGLTYPEACKKLEDAGAAVVGLNCLRGPVTMLPLLREIRKVCKGPIAALPVPFRTTPEEPTMELLIDPDTDNPAFPVDLPRFFCSRSQVADFARQAREIGVQYIGLCCGSASHYIRLVAEEYNRRPPASKYAPDMSKHYKFGKKTFLEKHHAGVHDV
ncbi:betaine--homocysteine S-methyltransferase 1-like isoform X1 [Ostrea edulis]|uniref:betaine--homocysteine S-methyltransferase 1-like isoform X1 n=1 Tax=Ostrea edulis TaxID=37623 RepID=UPI0024AF2B9F|nr:betaine--homocysteine S-methyltransferase 1-like isoform X1 [Ostrea edulis]